MNSTLGAPSSASPATSRRALEHGYAARALRRLTHQPATLVALTLLVSILIVGALASTLEPNGWNVLLLICVNLVGDGLDVALNPRARR